MYRIKPSITILALVAACVASSVEASPFVTGDIFASIGSGQIQHYNSAGTLLETLNTGFGGYTTGSASNGGNLYVTNFSSNSVSVFAGPGDPHTTSTFGGGYNTPEAIVFAGDGHVLVGNVGSGGIREFDAAGNYIKTIAPGVRVDWFDLAADQNTILFTQEGGQIRTASRSTGLVGSNFSSAGGDFALRILSDGTVLAADDSSVHRYDAAGNIIQTYDVTGLNGFFALNLDPDGTSFLTGSYSNGNIYRFDIASGGLDNQLQTIATGCGGSCLYGVSVYGEITAGNPPPTGGSVPEPASVALLGIGLSVLVGVRKHKRKTS
jgi:DNA-binding beta-propeller fold protein YncE